MAKIKIDSKTKAAVKSYLRAVAASAVTLLLANAVNFPPEIAIPLGAIAGPLAKWADKAEKEFGKVGK